GGNTIVTFSINQTTGALTQVGSPLAVPGNSPSGLAVDGSNHLYVALFGSGTIGQYTINTTTGALTARTTIASGTGPQRLAVSPSGAYLFASNLLGNTVTSFTINGGTGALTTVGS